MIPAANVEYMWNSVVLPRLGIAPYAWGGSFSPDNFTQGTDCSGAVSAELGALVNGPGMAWNRQFYTGTFAGANPGDTGPFGGVPETAPLVVIASPADAPPDAAMIIAIRQMADPTDSHMICQVQGVTIEMGGDNGPYHTNLTDPNCSRIDDTDEFNQWLYLPGLDPATPPPPGAPPPPQPVQWGIDISNNNFGGPNSPALGAIPGFVAEVVKEGFSFIEAKVSEGSGFADPTFTTIYQACQANNIICVGYHYVTTDNAMAQAMNFKAALNGASVPVMLDWENNGGNFDNYEAVWNAFRSVGLTPALEYIPKWYWQQQGSPNLADVTGLVSSSWVGGTGYASVLYPGDGWNGWDAYGGISPAILQFTDNAQVAGMTLDADAFRGSLDDLKVLLGLQQSQGDDLFMALTQAQQEDAYNAILMILQAVTGDLNPPIGSLLLPGSPTPVGSHWGPDPNISDEIKTLITSVSTLSADFTQTATGLAVLKKLSELNSILAGVS